MPWYVPWSENIKKRACRYLLQRYLGQFLEEKLTLDQLSVDLYNGTGTVSNVSLDCEALNELGETQGWPLEFVDGYVKKMNVSIPWATLLKDDSFVEVEGLTVTVQPKQRSESATSMLESMWSSMTSSMQLAAECLKQETDNSQPPQPVEGIELFAQTIDSILCRVKVKFTNTTVRMEHVPKDSNTGVALEIHIQHIDYLDEAGSDPPTELSDTEKSKTYVVSTFTTKRISFQGITFHTDEFPSKARTFAKSIILESTHKTKSNTSDEEATPNQETNYSSLYESCSLNSPQENWENDLNKIIKDVNLAENYNLIGDVGKSDREEFSKAMGGSNPILFGKMAGRQELRLKLKQSEEALGPHVDLQLTLGSLTLFLSPRQLHVLLELANGLASPHLEDNSNVPLRTHPGMESKPMQRLDFERVEAQLMGGLGAGRAPHSLSSRHGWSTANIDDSDEEDEKFLPLTSRRSAGVTPSGMSDSFCSSGSMSSSITSTASSLGGLQANRRRRAPPIEGDPAADVSQVHIRISSFACVLLHEDILTLSGSACGGVSASSVQQMQAASSAFFSRLGLFAVGGYGSQDMEQASKAFHEAVSFNHIRLLAAPVVLEGREKSSAHGSCISGQLTTARLDLRECLTNLSVPLLVFHNESQKESEKSGQDPMLNPLGKTPDVKVTFKHTQKAGKTTAERKYTQPKTEISVVMEPCTMEVDISLVDRLCAVLNPLPLCQTSSAQPATEAEPSTSPQQAMELSVTCPQLKVKLRFPIADLRPAHDMSRLAWWQRGVRPDLLLVLLQQVSLHSLPQQPEHSYRIQCRQLDLLYCPDCETDTEIHIGRATADDSTCSDPNAAPPTISWPSITITVLSPLESAGGLLESSSDGEAAGGGGTMGQSSAMLLDRLNSCPGPFSSKKMVHESDTPHSKTNQDDTEELVIPADSAEMSEFVEVAMKNSLLQIVCDLPTVSLQLGSKHLYEVLYNRINCDLLLWEPSAPRPGQHTRPSPADMHDSMYPAFSMCKSAINYDSDSGSSSSSTDSNVYYSVYDPRARQHTRSRSGKGGGAGGGTRPRRTRHNNFGFHLKIHKGLLTMYTPVRDSVNHVLPGQQGEIVISVETLSVCHIGGVAGDVRDALVSVTGANAHLYHCGLVPLSTEKMPLRLHGRSLPDHLKDTIYPSGKGVCMKQGGNPSRDMISVAISIKPNKDYPSFKTIKVSAGISNATLRHSMSPSQHSWLSQLLDMMDVEEYPVLGLQPGTVLTELHVHLWDAAIDYRPLHLPLRTVVTLGSFSISSNVVAQTEASNLRFIAEECALFLASGLPSSTREVDLRKDYVCVIDLGLLELSTRLNDKNIKTAPRVDLRASNNMVNIRTCSDSFRALCRLIDYLAGDGDLAEAPAPPGTPPHSDTDMPEELITMSERVPEEIRDLSQSQVQHVNQLMEEAMKESVSLDDLTGSDTNAVGSGVEVFFFPDEGLAGLGSPSQDLEALPLLEAAQEAVSALEGQEPMPQVQRELGDYRQTGKEKSPAASQKSKARKKSSSDNTDDEFCIVGEECVGKSSGDAPAEPAVRWLTEEPVNVIDNHFTLPVGKTDQLKPPKNFPMPVLRYTLCEMTLVWHMYGGQDFRTPADPETGKLGAGGSPAAGGAAPTRSSSLGPHRKTVTISDDTHSPTFQRRDRDPYNVVPGSPSTSYGSLGNGGVHYRRGAEGVTHSTAPPGSPREPPWRHKGGPQRRHDVLMELQLNKVRFQHELYPAGGAEASRQVLIVAAVEVRDRLASSQINKFLYQYTSEQRPARKHANMLVVKAVHLRPEPRLGVQECCLKVSLLPLRFNIDQDALLFLVAFFSESDQAIDSSLKTTDSGSTQSLHSLGGGSSRHSTPTHAPPVMSVTPSLLQRRSSCTSTSTSQLNMLSSCASSLEDSHSPRADDNEALLNSFEAERLVSENLILLEEDCLGGRGAAGGAAGRGSREPDTASLRSQTSRGSEPPADDAPIYFRNVVFSPEVPIRLDYQGKRVDLTHGPLAGLLMGLGQLNCSELRLKSLSYRHGLLGVERLVRWALQEWLGDIKRHQLPGLLGGVGPMHSLVQLFQGIRDLFWLPIEQYQRDGRLVRGLQRGASSFTTSTAMAALDITARIIQLIQATAETAYDMVSPSPGLRGVRGRGRRRRERPREPQDIREGVANAYHLVREGLGETAQALADVAVAERSARGYSGAVGGVLRQLPPTALAPLLLASAAANRVLGGVRAHLAPHQRKDQQDKWRQHNTNNS